MFSFFEMLDNYEERKVARFDQGDLMISTASVTDGQKPFETAVCHPEYNEGNHVIVENYDTKAQAEIGHQAWVRRMTEEPLPAQLVDCANAEIGQLCELAGCAMAFERGSRTEDESHG